MSLVDQHVPELWIRIDAAEDALQNDRLLKALVALLGRQEDLRHPAVGELANHRVSTVQSHT